MEREMMAWYPRKIKAVLIDDDTRFRKSSAKMLDLLNFKVSAFKSPAYALNRVLTGDKAKGIDVVFINTKKALTCGFDFRGVVQAELTIPVVYLLPRAHRAATAGNQVDQIRRTLRPGTYTISMPLDVEDVLRIWRSIAWSKCSLKSKQAARRIRRKEEQERIQLEQQEQLRQSVRQSILRALRMPSDNPGIFPDAAGPSNYLTAGVAAGNTAGPSSLPVYPPPRPVHSAPAPAPAPAPPPPPPVNPSLVPAQMPPPMYPYQGPQRPVMPQGLFAPPRQGGGVPRRGNNGPIMLNFQQPQAGDRFTGKASARASAAGHVGASSSYVATSLHHSMYPGIVGHKELPAMVPMHTGSNNPPVAPHPQQHVGVGSNVPAPYNNNGLLVAPEQAGAGHGVAANLAAAAAMEALGTGNCTDYNNAASLVAPRDDVPPAFDLAAFEAELNSDDFSNYTDGSLMASPDQVLGMASDLNDLITMAGGASGTHAAASSSMAPPHQDLAPATVTNANQIPPGAVGNYDDDMDASLMGPQGPGVAMDDGNDDAGLEAMFPDAEQNEDNLYFQLDELFADPGDAPTYEAGVGNGSHQMGGGTSGAGTGTGTADDAAATSLIGGESSMGIWDIDVEDFEVVDDFVPNGTGDFVFRMA